jgi:hypothetical protein
MIIRFCRRVAVATIYSCCNDQVCSYCNDIRYFERADVQLLQRDTEVQLCQVTLFSSGFQRANRIAIDDHRRSYSVLSKFPFLLLERYVLVK